MGEVFSGSVNWRQRMFILLFSKLWTAYDFTIESRFSKQQVIEKIQSEIGRFKDSCLPNGEPRLSGNCTPEDFKLEYHYHWRHGSSLMIFGAVNPTETGSIVQIKIRPHLFMVFIYFFLAMWTLIVVVGVPISYFSNPRPLNADFVPVLILLIFLIASWKNEVRRQYIKVRNGLTTLFEH